MPLSASFVTTDQTQFAIDGALLPVVGVNCYFLGYCSQESREAVIDTARAMGVNVIRSWAFLDTGERRAGSVAFQYLDNGAITVDGGPDGLERLDALIQTAEERDVRLILPLVNFWDDFGGMRQYLRWLNLPQSVEEFYRSRLARDAFRNWIRALLTRRNTRTGRLYMEEPAVLAWELANEPRCQVPGGRGVLMDWIGEMSTFVKELDTNHLLACGDEGFFQRLFDRDHLYNGSYGVDFEAILALPQIDFGTYHLYPKSWGHSNAFGAQWVADHAAAGRDAGKPVLFEEYGVELDPGEEDPVQKRNRVYEQWLDTVVNVGAAGDLLWMLGGTGPDVRGFRDSFTVLTRDEVPALTAHALRMGTLAPE